MRFQEKVVVVTGGSKGIGGGCSRLFCAEGGSVAILSRGREAGEALARELTDQGPGRAVYVPCDVAEPDQLERAIAGTVDQFGRVDCLINNAGWHPPAMTLEQTSLEYYEMLLRRNLVSTFAGCKFAVPHLRKTKGTIVNICSMVATLGQARAAAYCSTKAGQIGLTRALAVDLGPEGIRVNAVLPGNIDTPLMREWAATLDNPEQALEQVASLQVFKRLGTAEEIARVCLFLATEESSFLTGQLIQVEGGASLDY